MSGAPHPRMHGLTHVHGGPDPTRLDWEDVGTGSSSGGGGGYNAYPGAFGLVTWTINPWYTNQAALMAGNPQLVGVYLDADMVITTMAVPVVSGGSGTNTHFQLGVYDDTYARVAVSADDPSVVASTTWAELDLTAPYTTPAAGLYYLAYSRASSGGGPSSLIGTAAVLSHQNTFPTGVRPLFQHNAANGGLLPATAVPDSSTGIQYPVIIAF